MSIRLLLIGDVHLREGEQLDDVERCLEFARQQAIKCEVAAALLVGDIFEGKTSPEERAAFSSFLASLPCGAIVIKGNHDQPDELQVFSPYLGVEIFEEPTITAVTDAVDVLCVPWPEKAYLAANGQTGEAGDQAGSAALAAMLRGLVATREHPERPLVVLAHLQVLGAISSSAQPLVGRAIEATLGDLQDLGAAAVVLGHVHKPQELAPGIEYIGSLTVHDFGEEDEQKRVGILTIDDDGAANWEWIPVPCRRWVTIEAKIGALGRAEAVSEGPWFCLTDAEALPWEIAGANVRYRYTCAEDEQHLFDHAEIERRFAGAHTIKIVPQVTRTERVRAAEVAAARTAEEKFRAYCQVVELAPTESHIEKLRQLESEVANAG
jgi:exonuclease SbcD